MIDKKPNIPVHNIKSFKSKGKKRIAAVAISQKSTLVQNFSVHMPRQLWYKENMEYKVAYFDHDILMSVYIFRSEAHFLDWFRAKKLINHEVWIDYLSCWVYNGELTDATERWQPFPDEINDMQCAAQAPKGYETGSLPIPTDDDDWDDVIERERAFARSALPSTMSIANLTMSVESLLDTTVTIRKSRLKQWRFDATTEVNGEELFVAHMMEEADGWELTSEYIELWKKKM